MKPSKGEINHDIVLRDFYFPVPNDARKILRIVIFSAQGIPVATAVFDGLEMFKKKFKSNGVLTLVNRTDIYFRWVKHEVYKLTHFRIYPIRSTETDGTYFWGAKFKYAKWASGRGVGSVLALKKGDLVVSW